jgi:hypothetical protein
MLNEHNRNRQRLLGWMTLSGGVFVLLFWVLYFSRAVDLGQHDPLIHAFESAFPLADSVFAAVLFAAAYHLLKGKRSGQFFLVVAGSMSLYLGVLDTTFYVSHGIFSPFGIDALVGLTVNALCIGGGVIALYFGWRYWSVPAASRGPAIVRHRPRTRRPVSSSGVCRNNSHLTDGETEKTFTEVAA